MDVQFELTRIDKRVERIDAKVDDIRDDISGIGEMLKAMAKSEARIDELSRLVVAHDKRIVAIEKECSARNVRLSGVEQHVGNDKPVEQFVNEKAAKLLYALLGGVVVWFAGKLPMIIRLLGE